MCPVVDGKYSKNKYKERKLEMKNYLLAGVMLLSLSTVFTAGYANAGFAPNVNLTETTPGNIFGVGADNWSEVVGISGPAVNPDGNYSAGAFRVTDGVADYLAFCFELAETLDFNPDQDYAVTQAPPSNNSTVGGLLNNLFHNWVGGVDSAIEAAAFQVAIWEIVSDLGSINLAAGNFKLDSASSAVQTKVAEYLGDLTGPGTDYELFYFRSNGAQDLILWEDNLSNNEASAPATSILIALSLGGLVLVRRKLA